MVTMEVWWTVSSPSPSGPLTSIIPPAVGWVCWTPFRHVSFSLLRLQNADTVLDRTLVVWLPTLFPPTCPMVWVVARLFSSVLLSCASLLLFRLLLSQLACLLVLGVYYSIFVVMGDWGSNHSSFLIGFGLTFASNGPSVSPCEHLLTIHQPLLLRCWLRRSLTPHIVLLSLELTTLSGISEL